MVHKWLVLWIFLFVTIASEAKKLKLISYCEKKSDCKKGYKCMLNNCVLDYKKGGENVRSQKNIPDCETPSDPLNLPVTNLSKWFTREAFYDLFPIANIGYGPHKCLPYSYESFIIAASYFPAFGTTSPDNGFTPEQNYRRDLATFFANVIQETGENSPTCYPKDVINEKGDACFYRGGLFEWYEQGDKFLYKTEKLPTDGDWSTDKHYCDTGDFNSALFRCSEVTSTCCNKTDGKVVVSDNPPGDCVNKFKCYRGSYFGRGPLQISYNYNYGYFRQFLRDKGYNKKQLYELDVVNDPNLVIRHTKPPLALMASLWFYMTPQPPKPAMHDIIMGEWEPGPENRKQGYEGAVFGPSSRIINNECGGEKEGFRNAAESRRIKAFKWFCHYFGVPHLGSWQKNFTISCKDMPVRLEHIKHSVSYGPANDMWKTKVCRCDEKDYQSQFHYYDPKHYPRFAVHNKETKLRCEKMLYMRPDIFQVSEKCTKP